MIFIHQLTEIVGVTFIVSPEATERDAAKSDALYNVPEVPLLTVQTNAPATVAVAFMEMLTADAVLLPDDVVPHVIAGRLPA